MNLNTALEHIAAYLVLDATELIAYAAKDSFTGWDNNQGQFPVGSIWGVEGQVLYALVRALKPMNPLELGVYYGASATHLIAALQANGSGVLTSVDHHSGDSGAVEIGSSIPATQKADFHYIEQRIQHYLATLEDNSVDFIFEDAFHDIEGTKEIYQLALVKLAPNGVIVSHDSEHPTAGPTLRAGIEVAGVTDYLSLLIEPSDCGLAIWRKRKSASDFTDELTAKATLVTPDIDAPKPPTKPTAKRAPAKKTTRKAKK